ncbi:S-formylglutathione hydrolase [Kerstersia similis]|uniref:S-formylglutathione hydrolase n=1 Tax=Kerstersia similis TaxID=206505 RepID=UPI0039EF98C1
MSELELLSQHRAFEGSQRYYRHLSAEIGLPMRFSVYLPPEAGTHDAQARRPVLFFLAGLTCTEETFMIKAGAQRLAAQAGMILVTPDTSPRGAGVPGEDDSWDFGTGAGFYLDATQAPWREHYRMDSYIVKELVPLVQREFQGDPARTGIFGHSMGGHGALVLALRNPDVFRSVSAFAPIAAPSQCPWGHKALGGYLGDDRAAWAQYDASELMRKAGRCVFPEGILIDQGLDDGFLQEQLHPHLFEQACAAAGQALVLNRRAGYDHGYYFISSFIDGHIDHHARILKA